MQDISAVDLHVDHVKLSLAIDDNATGVCFLTTRLGVEIGAIENEPTKLA